MNIDTKKLSELLRDGPYLYPGPTTCNFMRNAAKALDAQEAEISRWKDLFETTTQSVCSALVRHGVQSVDDPGEAIDVLVADRDAEINRLRQHLEWTEQYAKDSIKSRSRDIDDWAGDMECIASSSHAALAQEPK